MDEAEKQRLDRQAIRGSVARGDRTRSQNMRALEQDELARGAPVVPVSVPVMTLPPLDEDLRDILGRPNFTCIGISQRLREMGYSIKHRAEDEQATVIHLLLQHYFANGPAWRDTVQAFLARHKPDADQGAPAADPISSVHGPDDKA